MELGLAPIVLLTQKSEPLCHFLSQLLDMGITPLEKGVLLKHDLLSFKVLETEEINEPGQMSLIEFKVENIEELAQIKQKVEFLSYRNQLELIPEEEENNSITIFDTDGRKWLFSLKE